MDKKSIDEVVISSVYKYIEKIKELYEIQEVYLFGSFAKGNEHADSDIDIAIISNDFNDRIDAMIELMLLTQDIDLRIEPHPFNEKDFNENSPFVDEIKNTGLKVA